MINQPKLDKAHLIMLEELAKKSKHKPDSYLKQLLAELYSQM